MLNRLFKKIKKRKLKNKPVSVEDIDYQELALLFEKLKKELLREEVEEPKYFDRIKAQLLMERTKEEQEILSRHRRLLREYEIKFKKLENLEKSHLNYLKKKVKQLEKKIRFIKRGGNRPISKLLSGLDTRLRKKFNWYLKWHLNPISSLVHYLTLLVYVLGIGIGILIAFYPSATPLAKTTIALKSSQIDQIKKGDQNLKEGVSAQAIDLGNVVIDFGEESKTAFVWIKTLRSPKDKPRSFRFELLQPEEQIKQSTNGVIGKAEGAVKNEPSTHKIPAKVKEIKKTRDGFGLVINPDLELEYRIEKLESQIVLKETVIIKNPRALSVNPDYHLSFSFLTEGVNLQRETDGGYLMTDEKGEVVARVLAPKIEDKKKKKGEVNLQIKNSLASFIIDPTFVNQAEFPLYLDPSVVISSSTTTNPNSFTKDRTLLEATNGSMIQIYSDGSALNYKISTDHGNNWGTASEIITSSLVDDYGFSSWIDSNNKIHLVYSHNGTDSYIFYRQMTFDTGTNTITSTGTEYTVESTGASQAFPSVTRTSGGTIYVAYRYYDGSNYTVKVKSSTNNGASWSSATTLSSTTSSSALYPSLTLWSDKPAVIYNFANSSLRWNYYTGSTWQSPGWTYETIASDVGSNLGTEFSISQPLSDNYLHLTFKDDSSGIKYRKLESASDPSKWDSSSTSITSGGNHANDRNPAIGIGFNNAIYLYYSEYVASNSYNIKYVEKIGSAGSFGTGIAVTTDNANNLFTQSALKPSPTSGKNPYAPVIYVSGSGGSYNLNYAPTVKVWSAASAGNWETASNWTPAGAPQAGDFVIFDSTSVQNCTVTTYTSGNGIADGIGGIYVNSGYTGTINFQKKPSQGSDPYKINIVGDFFINSGTVTTEGDTEVSGGKGNEFLASNIVVASGASFSADGKGFSAKQGPGGSSSNGIGASYGGEGYGADPSKAYGDYSNPTNLGSGGNSYAGGGAVILTASNTLDISGTISVNGVGSTSGYSAGSGGSVNLTALVISGSGTITANGGVCSSLGAGGSGGRIKLSATSISFSGTLSAKGGGASSVSRVGAAGTIFKKLTSQTYGDLIIDNGTNTPQISQQYAAHLNSSSDTGSYQFDSITFQNYGRLAIDLGQTFNLSYGTISGDKNSGFVNAGTVIVPDSWTINYLFSDKNGTVSNLSSKSITISSSGRLSHYPNPAGNTEVYKLNWTVANLTIQSGGEINVDGCGFASTYGPGGSSSNGIGASYGGEGYGADPSKVYGDYSNPTNLGSGGNGYRGGGAIILNVSNTLNISGTISSNGQIATGTGTASAGSGGSVNLSASTISGNGSVTAIGGEAGGGGVVYSGGGGGRVKLSAGTINYSGTISARAGSTSTNYKGAAGTIFKKLTSQTYGDLIIDNSTVGANSSYTHLTAPISLDNLTISNYGQLRIAVNSDPSQNNLTLAGDLTLSSNAILSLMADNDGNPAKGAGITVTAENVSVGSGCAIQSNATGFPANTGYANGRGLVGTTYGGGGAFGGVGGDSNDGGAGGQPYGSETDVEYIGSGGGASGGGAGGGFMKFVVSDTITNSGTISVNGGNGATNGGGGSGGGLLIITKNINSAGTISANGGNGVSSAGGGGGGRIFIITSGTKSINPEPTANGGTGANNGSAGTVAYQSSPNAPSLSSPGNSQTNISQSPSFVFSTTDAEGDWVRYKVQLATNSSFTENLSEFIQGDTQEGQTQTSNGITATFTGQDTQNGTAYQSGTTATLTISSSTPLDEGTTYYWRVYAKDPGGSGYFGPASLVYSFTVAPISKIVFTTNVTSVEVTTISAQMTVEIRNSIDETVKLKSNQNFNLSASPTTTEHFYSDSGGQNEITGFTISAGESSYSFYYKDETPSLTPYTITVAETHPTSEGTEDWDDAEQEITVYSGALDHFVMSGYSTSVVAGNNLGEITVEAIDVHGKRKLDFTGEVWFGSTDSQAEITHHGSNHYTFTSGTSGGEDNGIHTFSASEIVLKTKGSQTITLYNNSNVPSVTSDNITVSPAATDHFAISSYPRTALGYYAMAGWYWNVGSYSNAPYNPQVTVYDAYNNIKDDFTGEVWFELYMPSDPPGNPENSTADYDFTYDYTNHYTFTTGEGGDNGIHVFSGSNFLVNSAGSNLRLRVKTSDNGGKYLDVYITIQPQAIDHFSVTADPILSRGGTNWEKELDTTFSEAIIVTAYDILGNVKTDYAYNDSTKEGMIYFYSSDSYAVLPYYKTSASETTHCFAFPSDAAGIYTFDLENTPNNYFKFQSGGLQTISVSECIDPQSSYGQTKYDPRFQEPGQGQTAVATGQLPAEGGTPNRIAVPLHQPGSTHTGDNHSNNENNLIEASPGNQQVTISWYNPFDYPTDESLDAQVYFYRCSSGCDNSENFTKINTDPSVIRGSRGQWSEYTDTGLENGTTYYYKLSYVYKKNNTDYIESNFSTVVSATPADIAPRDVSAIQLDVSDPNAGKVKVEYKLRWTSTVSLAFFNPNNNLWVDASAQAMSGDVGPNIEGSEELITHTAYFDPNIDFDGQYLINSFKMRVKVVVGGNNSYADSSLISLDSKDPINTSLLVNAGKENNKADLTLHAEDDSGPIKMMISNREDFSGASWQDYATSVSDWNITGAQTIYVRFRDNFNNITSISNNLLSAPSNVQIKDASNSSTSEFRLAIIWSRVNLNNIKQYNIWRSTDGQNFSSFGYTSQNGYLDTDLDPNTTYYYKITTEDSLGNISPFSAVVYSKPGLAPDITADPEIQVFGWRQDVGVKAVISWHTDQLADSFVAYATEPLAEGAVLKTTSGDTSNVKVVGLPELTLDHSVTLYNLEPSTKYYFKVLSKNQIQITGYSKVYNFTTPERILLLISGVNFSNITNTSAIISWETSKLSQTVLKYGKTTAYSETIEDKTWNTKHQFELKNLSAGDYHLRIWATDSDGNVTISDDYVFTIPPYPSVSDVKIVSVGETTAKIEWKTNVPCNSNVDIEGESTSGSQGSAEMVTSHSVNLIGLSPKTTYNFKVRSIDQFGNIALGPRMSFTTTTDTTPPQIKNQQSQITSTGTGDNIRYQLIVTWETDEPATSKVEYGAGMGNSYPNSSKEDLSLNITHTVIISDLMPNSLYHYRIKTIDKSGNISFSDDSTIVTPPKQQNIITIIVNVIKKPLSDIYHGILRKFRSR